MTVCLQWWWASCLQAVICCGCWGSSTLVLRALRTRASRIAPADEAQNCAIAFLTAVRTLCRIATVHSCTLISAATDAST